MKRLLSFVLLVILVGAAVFYWPKTPQVIPKSAEDAEFVPEHTARIFAEQDAVYRGRYGSTEALIDLSKGKPKLLLTGFPRTFDEEWRTIIRERFGVETESGVVKDEGEFIDFEERWTGAYIFENQWQSFRTRQDRELELKSAKHTYEKPGRYTIAVKVIDIFGNDTTTLVPVTVG